MLVGEFDIPDVHAHAGAIEAGISGAKREIIYNSGHLIPIEQPDAFNSAVEQFLKGMEFFNILNSKGVTEAANYYHEKVKSKPDISLFEERELNSLGYRYMQNGNIKDAIEIFKLNTEAFPNSGNVYDSLGEAYLNDGQIELAVTNYKKSLEVNPNNTNAKAVLEQLKNRESNNN